MMEKQHIIDMMQQHGFAETSEELYEHGDILYSVHWTRLSDGFVGPTVVSPSAQEAFTDSALQALVDAPQL